MRSKQKLSILAVLVLAGAACHKDKPLVPAPPRPTPTPTSTTHRTRTAPKMIARFLLLKNRLRTGAAA